MTAAMAPTADRFAHREATRRMRINAGIRTAARPEAIADFGAAARRLRASNAFGASQEITPETIVDVRQEAAHHDSYRRNAALAGRASSLLASLRNEA